MARRVASRADNRRDRSTGGLARTGRTAHLDVGREDDVPETIGDAEVSVLVKMMMEHMPAREPVAEGGGLNPPMVDDVMGAAVEEVAQHDPAGETGGDHRSGEEPQRDECKDDEQGQAQPDRRSDQGLLVAVMLVVQFLDVRNMVQHIAVEQIFCLLYTS